MKNGVLAGKYQLVFFTPELLILKSQWRELLLTKLYREKVKAFIVDEAHCVRKW